MTSSPNKEDSIVKNPKRQDCNASLTKVIILLAVLTSAIFLATVLMSEKDLMLSVSKAGDWVCWKSFGNRSDWCCSMCSSLFKNIPPKRCADTGIPPTCPCMECSEISNTSSLYQNLGGFLVDRLNFILGRLQKDVLDQKNKCANFTLERTLSVKRVIPKPYNVSTVFADVFIISIEIQPKTMMEALVRSMNDSVRIIDSLLKPASNDSRTRCFDYLTYPEESVKSAFS